MTVYNRFGDYLSEGDIQGPIRFIRERDGLLPMERYLGIEVDVGGDHKIEPGNLAIAEESNYNTWPEIMMHLLSGFANQNMDGRPNHYLTYADKYSKKMYSRLGFKPVPLDRIKLGPGAVVKNGAIVVDGIDWTPMEATSSTLEEVYREHLAKMKKSEVDSEVVDQRRIELNLSQNSWRHLYFIGTPTVVGGRTIRAAFKTHKDVGDQLNLIILMYEEKENGDWQYIKQYNLGYLDPRQLPMGVGELRAPEAFATYYGNCSSSANLCPRTSSTTSRWGFGRHCDALRFFGCFWTHIAHR